MLAALALLALLAAAEAQFIYCTTVIIGKVTDDKHVLPDTFMPAGVHDFQVNVPSVCPPIFQHVGTNFTACDDYSAPDVKPLDLDHAFIHREGSGSSEHDVIKVIVYCGNSLSPDH